MKSIIIFYIFLIATALCIFNKEARVPFPEYCEYFNYPVENHTVTTADGYILTLFRIQAKNSQIVSGKPVVFLQHGLLDCSDSFIINKEERAPAFYFANQGYDVWLGNSRGNKWSLGHVSMDAKNDRAYWQFSFQQMGEYDLPAVFEYVSSLTGQKINYIGHSQGTMQMFVALSERIPQVVNNLEKYIAWGPVAYIRHLQFFDFHRMILWFNWLMRPTYAWTEDKYIPDRILPQSWFITQIGSRMCSLLPSVCEYIIGFITNKKPRIDDYLRYDVVAGHDPAGASLQDILHFEQLEVSSQFQMFDYGTEINLQKYGQATPPLFNLQDIQENVALFVGTEDKLADVKDAEHLREQLTSSQEVIWKEYEAGHLTYQWGFNNTQILEDSLAIINGSLTNKTSKHK